MLKTASASGNIVFETVYPGFHSWTSDCLHAVKELQVKVCAVYSFSYISDIQGVPIKNNPLGKT